MGGIEEDGFEHYALFSSLISTIFLLNNGANWLLFNSRS
jgi:hypothetical protein